MRSFDWPANREGYSNTKTRLYRKNINCLATHVTDVRITSLLKITVKPFFCVFPVSKPLDDIEATQCTVEQGTKELTL